MMEDTDSESEDEEDIVLSSQIEKSSSQQQQQQHGRSQKGTPNPVQEELQDEQVRPSKFIVPQTQELELSQEVLSQSQHHASPEMKGKKRASSSNISPPKRPKSDNEMQTSEFYLGPISDDDDLFSPSILIKN